MNFYEAVREGGRGLGRLRLRLRLGLRLEEKNMRRGEGREGRGWEGRRRKMSEEGEIYTKVRL